MFPPNQRSGAETLPSTKAKVVTDFAGEYDMSYTRLDRMDEVVTTNKYRENMPNRWSIVHERSYVWSVCVLLQVNLEMLARGG